jgi:hypothetical protein
LTGIENGKGTRNETGMFIIHINKRVNKNLLSFPILYEAHKFRIGTTEKTICSLTLKPLFLFSIHFFTMPIPMFFAAFILNV